MAFTEIQPAAFVPDSSRGPFETELHTLAFPPAWREPVLELFKSSKSEARRDRIKEIPIRSLNSLLRTVAPDLVAVDANASFTPDHPWLYSRSDYPPRALARLVRAWLRDMAPGEEGFHAYRDTARKLDFDELRWQPERVDLLEHELSPGGTCVPAQRLYRVLPEVLADRIAAQPPYEFCGEHVRFHRVAVDARASGAELMSWPPLEHTTKVKEANHERYGSQRTWYYSAVITLSLRTVPFSPIPHIHVSTSIRRWVSGQVSMSGRQRVSAYLLTTKPFLAETPDLDTIDTPPPPGRFAVAQFAWKPHTGQIEWSQGGTEGMLANVGAIEELPGADIFAKEPDTWIHGRDGLFGAASHHTQMGWHGIGAGLMPAERRRLTEWAGAALAPEFVPAPPLTRSPIKQRNPSNLLTSKVPVPKPSRNNATDPEKLETEQKIAAAQAQNDIIELDNAVLRRQYTARALDGGDLTAVLLYQSEHMRDQLITAAEANLGLADYREESGPEVWTWASPDLRVRIHARELGSLGAPLGTDKAPQKGKEHDGAMSARRSALSSYLRDLAADLRETTNVAFVELDGRESFRQRRTDPKFAIRLGCADAGMVSQFLTPGQPTDPDDDAAFRVEAAWADGLRQLGMRFLPEHTLSNDTIPDELNQVAFWLVKHQAAGTMGHAQFTPVAILIRPGRQTILGRTPDTNGWVPYPQLLIALTGQIRPDDLATADQQTKATAIFVKNTLYTLRSEPTLVVTHARNTRSRWPWLTNSGLLPNRIQLGNGPAQRLRLFGPKLRIARIAGSDRNETPQSWAPKTDKAGRASAGISKGLWKPTDRDDQNRIFYSTSDKPGTHTLSVDSTKLTHTITAADKPEIHPDKNAWNPELLQIAMVGFPDATEAEHWAMFLHQQRFAEDYRNALGLPLILHLAELTDHYGLPHDDGTVGVTVFPA
ncbi:pPIWI_RE module domain-containing protein [Saccharopolyspora endophytica]|uniref:DUF3962 domain-containing protein n=1 Tax=Saccharopolyspora endophytica TaxID=543886 RepID=A0ABS5DQP2_9PSEU|nr:DUF3962 domain-containing protein [Saccharopolyspora endophytica]MBQ0928626.1 DUF3962 domain-containing protein [Saccharopolyspora endophytica]